MHFETILNKYLTLDASIETEIVLRELTTKRGRSLGPSAIRTANCSAQKISRAKIFRPKNFRPTIFSAEFVFGRTYFRTPRKKSMKKNNRASEKNNGKSENCLQTSEKVIQTSETIFGRPQKLFGRPKTFFGHPKYFCSESSDVRNFSWPSEMLSHIQIFFFVNSL